MKKLIINYKAYREGIDHGEGIAKIANTVAKKFNVDIIVSPPFTMLKELSKMCKTIAQGVDEIDPGAFTGHVSWYEIKQSGAMGTLLNHSEERCIDSKNGAIVYSALKKAIDLCTQNGLETYVCVQNINEALEVCKMDPTAIAYEPPELIGGIISVSDAQPEIVKEFIELVNKNCSSIPLIGAGIKTAADVKKAVELGSAGILVASGVVKSKDLKSAISELAEPLA